MAAPQRASQGGGEHGQLHLGFEIRVSKRFVRQRHVAQVDALGRLAVLTGDHQIAVDGFGDEGEDRGEALGEGDQNPIQGGVGGGFVGVVLGLPEAATTAPDIPVGQFFDELNYGRHRAVEPVRLHLFVDNVNQRLQFRQDPAVQSMHRGCTGALPRRPAVDVGIGDEEAVGVPQRHDNGAETLPDTGFSEA